MWCVYNLNDMCVPVACFGSFWDASDYIGDHPEQRLHIMAGEPFVPVITEADIDAYLACDDKPTSYGDPRDGFDDSPRSMAQVLYFLGWVAQYKSLDVGGPIDARYYDEHFGYETMLYAYHDVADAIAAL